jgi:hypothetical protein
MPARTHVDDLTSLTAWAGSLKSALMIHTLRPDPEISCLMASASLSDQ